MVVEAVTGVVGADPMAAGGEARTAAREARTTVAITEATTEVSNAVARLVVAPMEAQGAVEAVTAEAAHRELAAVPVCRQVIPICRPRSTMVNGIRSVTAARPNQASPLITLEFPTAPIIPLARQEARPVSPADPAGNLASTEASVGEAVGVGDAAAGAGVDGVVGVGAGASDGVGA